jgi:hypothetical protein
VLLAAAAGIMWAAMAAPEEPHMQPQPMNNWSSFFFFAAFVLVVAYTLLNLYIGETRVCTPAADLTLAYQPDMCVVWCCLVLLSTASAVAGVDAVPCWHMQVWCCTKSATSACRSRLLIYCY